MILTLPSTLVCRVEDATHIRANVMKFSLNIQSFPSFLVGFIYSLSFVLIHIYYISLQELSFRLTVFITKLNISDV